ncbi:hypothetical protein LO763_27450 [Glycomyces sp. A-F 0318]|uniref:hypothetical protein n=1 Tax=Glycomyces amatae TaxID=2881355 RepID=UPI001E5EDF34|nr:hypothetical protein [Glycomyces amatae]MCD0447358.1 hypothetical protein [Glycomyces amatae]
MKMSKKKRAKVVRRVATGAVAATAVGVAVAGVAVAARRTEEALPKLPAPGATIEVDLASKGIELVFVGQRINTGPLKGKATYEIESNKGDPSSVQTRVSEFYLTSPAKQGGVTIAVDTAARADKGRSVLRHEKPGSPRLHHTMEMPLSITVRYPEVLGLPADTEEPLSLTAKDAATLVARLNGFPLKGTRYKLKEETALSLPGQPHSDASILKFPVKVEGL